jgi:hypothetical protein
LVKLLQEVVAGATADERAASAVAGAARAAAAPAMASRVE